MRLSWISSRLAFRLLAGMLLMMALLDVPVTIPRETGGVLSVLALFGVLAGASLVAWRRRTPNDLPHSTVVRRRRLTAAPEIGGRTVLRRLKSAVLPLITLTVMLGTAMLLRLGLVLDTYGNRTGDMV